MEENESLERKLPRMSTSSKVPYTMDVSSPMSVMDVPSPRRAILKSSVSSAKSSGVHTSQKDHDTMVVHPIGVF
jgi:hypothetical protein